jgi:hypothetical protein
MTLAVHQDGPGEPRQADSQSISMTGTIRQGETRGKEAVLSLDSSDPISPDRSGSGQRPISSLARAPRRGDLERRQRPSRLRTTTIEGALRSTACGRPHRSDPAARVSGLRAPSRCDSHFDPVDPEPKPSPPVVKLASCVASLDAFNFTSIQSMVRWKPPRSLNSDSASSSDSVIDSVGGRTCRE